MTVFQQTSVCSISPFLSVLSANNNVLDLFPLMCVFSRFKQAVVPFILKEEVSFNMTSFPTASFLSLYAS